MTKTPTRIKAIHQQVVMLLLKPNVQLQPFVVRYIASSPTSHSSASSRAGPSLAKPTPRRQSHIGEAASPPESQRDTATRPTIPHLARSTSTCVARPYPPRPSPEALGRATQNSLGRGHTEPRRRHTEPRQRYIPDSVWHDSVWHDSVWHDSVWHDRCGTTGVAWQCVARP